MVFLAVAIVPRAIKMVVSDCSYERSSMDRQFSVTSNAARRIETLIAAEDRSGLRMRVEVQGGGCSGFQYQFKFDDILSDDDHIFEANGIDVVVDDTSLDLLDGAELDYVEELIGAFFQVNNPNAASSCCCGTSFSV